jgi:hypothetical protein
MDVEQEQEITDNLGSAHINVWRKLRLTNPYRFHERQYKGSDKRFWTDSQLAMWNDYYDADEHMKSGFYVVPKSLNVEHFQHYVSKDFRYINEALLKMDILDLVTLTESIQPMVVRQFFCTVFFHNDPEETFSWMTGKDVFHATFADFCGALGYGEGRAGGFKIHSEAPFPVERISRICYPDVPSLPAPAISGMYYYYNALAKLFRQNLISKAGDDASVRGYHRNLLFYCQPDKLRKIDGCDFIFQEMKRSTLKRMTPNYCQYVQRLINRHPQAQTAVVRGQVVDMETFSVGFQGGFEEAPTLPRTRARGPSMDAPDPHRPSGSGTSHRHRHRHSRPSRKKGVAAFFKSMWEMCRSSYDVAHRSLEMSQETRKRQNEFLAARGGAVPPIGRELDPVPYVNYVMPPLDDDMFAGVEDFEDFEPPSEPEDADDAEGAGGEDDPEASPVPSDDF